MSLMAGIALALHNFPEGLATFAATLTDTSVGASLGVAIAIHNIPEGACCDIIYDDLFPVFVSTNRLRLRMK